MKPDIECLRYHVERARLIEQNFQAALANLRGIANRLDRCLHDADLVLARLETGKVDA